MDFLIDGPVGKLDVRAKGLKPGAKVVLLVQGANLSGQLGYDFSFPGGEGYSLMDALVAAGFGAVTFALRGYRRSDPPADPMSVQTEQAIEDLTAVMSWLEGQGYQNPHLAGWSWGGRIAGRFVERFPGRVDRLVLLDPALGGGNKVLPAPTNPWWENTHEYFFERLEVEFTELAARKALAEQVSATEPRSPNGIRMENAIGSVPPDVTKLNCPVLMVYGDAAGKQNYMQGGIRREAFFEAIPSGDKQLVIVPGGGDYAHMQNPRFRVQQAMIAFLKPVA